MGGMIAPFPKHQIFDDNGDVAVGYQLFTYEAGTTTKLATFTDVDLTSANTNPIILDASGRATIFLAAASYKFVLAPPTDTDPPASPVWTQDNVTSPSPFTVFTDVSGTAGQDLSARDCVFLADGTEGGTVAGRWYKTDGSDNQFSSNAIAVGFVVSDVASGAALSIRIVGKMEGFSALTVGATYYVSDTAGEISTTPGSNSRGVAQADTTTSLIVLFGMKSYIP